jgi:signal transduction histidine kinase
MNKDMDLINSLGELAYKNTIEYIIETGTHRGLGSTTMLGNAFKNSSSLKSLNTIEIDYTNYSLAKKNIKFETDFNFAQNLEVVTDKIILQQILSNLISNAEKFTIDGSILLSVTHQEETLDFVRLSFKVSDTGIGIDDGMREVIFEKFKQLPSVKFHKSQGSGLGLNIVKQLLALQNSKIEVNSVKGEGSTFFFDLVFEKAQSSHQTIISRPNLAVNTQFSTIQVLVVEDNDLNQ